MIFCYKKKTFFSNMAWLIGDVDTKENTQAKK